MNDVEASPQRILIVDDELNIRKMLAMCLEADGHQVISVSNPKDALAEASRRALDIAFLDLRLGTADGMELIVPLLSETPWLKIVIITAHASIETAVEAIRRGASDYLAKPFTPAQVTLAVAKAAALRAMENRIANLQEAMAQDTPAVDLQSDSPAMQRVLEQARRVAQSEAAILLRGEHGTGKTLLAEAIHAWSPRSGKPFGVVSCPSLSGPLLESELFGHVRGAFTGAVNDHPGRVAKCDGGTLFLDEIGDMAGEMQAKLLRFLQDKSYERVGDAVTRRADVRLITATNVHLEEAVKAGDFREDLLYRLNVVELEIPPLRERKEDIPRLSANLLAFFARRNGTRITGFTEAALRALVAHPWPGNVRELRNAIERASIFCTQSQVGPEHLPGALGGDTPAGPELGDPVSLEVIEEQHIRRVLATAKSLQEAADILGIDQATLWRRRKQFEL